MNVGRNIGSLDFSIERNGMLLAALSCLLGYCVCDCTVEILAIVQSLYIFRHVCQSGVGYAFCQCLEIFVFGNEIGLASKAYYYALCLVGNSLCNYRAFCCLTV